MNIEETIRKQIAENPVLIYMKGVPTMPQCGFSAKAVSLLETTGVQYSFVNVLASPHIREILPLVSNWPTFPQLFISGELVGGSDIMGELARSGELKTLVDVAVASQEVQ